MARFDGNSGGHYHVCRVRCDRVDGLRDRTGDFVKGNVESLSGYEILGLRLESIGVCPARRSRYAPERSAFSMTGQV